MIEMMARPPRSKLFGSGPGPQELVLGDAQAGYFGLVSAQDFYTGTQLAAALGVTEGSVLNDSTDWFKFAHKGIVIFTPVKPIRAECSWKHLYERGAVYPGPGNGPLVMPTPTEQYRVISKGGWDYNCILASLDPDSPNISVSGASKPGSEWLDLVYRMTTSAPANTRWGDYTAVTLGIVTPNLYGWVQQNNSDDNSGNSRICTYYVSIEGFGYASYNDTRNIIAWRPYLRVVNS